MTNTKFTGKILLGLLLSLLALAAIIVNAQVYPSEVDDNGSTQWNSSIVYTNKSMLNHSRGTIYRYNFVETAPTIRWKAYVGNITGTYGLFDNDKDAIYRWSVVTTTGEVYATPFNGIPDWNKLNCTNRDNITQWSIYFNHTYMNNISDSVTSMDSISKTHVAEDAFDLTWNAANQVVNSFNHSNFWAGSSYIENNSCYGMNLYQNNAESENKWEELLLTEKSNVRATTWGYPNMSGYPAGSVMEFRYNMIFTVFIKNNTDGYKTGVDTYDFQIMLPEYGLPAANPPQTGYYFYIELM